MLKIIKIFEFKKAFVLNLQQDRLDLLVPANVTFECESVEAQDQK